MKLKDLKEDFPLIHRVASSYIDPEYCQYKSFLKTNFLKDAFGFSDTEEGSKYWFEVIEKVGLKEKEEDLIKIVNESSKYWTVNTVTYNYIKVLTIEGMNDVENEWVDIIQEDYPKNNFIRLPKHSILSVIKKVNKAE